jgi:hypothetical protein
VLFNARLFPDMLPLTKQIQTATDTASGGVARLAGNEPPVIDHNETTFAALVARVQKTTSAHFLTLKRVTVELIAGKDRCVRTLPL